jgi:hypothetical protein
MEEQLSNLTYNQAKVALALCGAGCAIQFVAGRVLLKHVEKIEQKNKHLVKATRDLARIAVYEAKLIDKHVDGRHLDEFDVLVLTDLDKDLDATLDELRKLDGKILDPEEAGENESDDKTDS